jgi:hypothetical protein
MFLLFTPENWKGEKEEEEEEEEEEEATAFRDCSLQGDPDGMGEEEAEWKRTGANIPAMASMA